MKRSYIKAKGFGVTERQPLEETLFSKEEAKKQLKNYKNSGYRNLELRKKSKAFQIFGRI